eukprot:m.173202 g.173202  ORF g.173202 m.173202 type:complete len:456 (-) comp17867_c0_seq1:185-1552(-)
MATNTAHHRHNHLSPQTESRRKSRGLSSGPMLIQGGFDEQRFTSAVPEHFKCPICLDVLRDPVQCPEEHAFCQSCIHFHLAAQKMCPECKTELSVETLMPWSRVLRNLLADLKLTCEHAADGCTAVVSLGDLVTHEKSCQYGTQPCRFCREGVPAMQLKAHEIRCPQRSIVCKECGLRNYPNRPPKHNCVKALQARVKGLAAHSEQLRVDFEQRLRPYARYVQLHESGSYVSWKKVVESVNIEEFQTRGAPNSSGVTPRTAAPRTAEVQRSRQDVTVASFSFNEKNKHELVDLRNNGYTMTSNVQDSSGGCAVGTACFSSGVWYWEVHIEAMWDSEGSDGSIRVGFAIGGEPDFASGEWASMALGDDMTTIGWWDDTIDGAVFTEIADSPRMKEGMTLGLLLDLENTPECRLELYMDKLFVGEIAVPKSTYSPACFTRTEFDRVTLVQNPTLPDM